MAADTLKKSIFRWLPITVIGILLLVSLSFLHVAMNKTGYSQEYTTALVYLNAFILAILSIAILINLVRVIYQWHMRQAGSRFTLRLLAGFLVLTLLPVIVVSTFSMNFIGKNINRQLDGQIEGALDDALELARLSLSTGSRGHLQELSVFGERLGGKNRLEIAALMDSWRERSGAYEAILLSKDLSYVINSNDSLGSIVPLFTGEDLLKQLSSNLTLTKIETTAKDGVFSRVAIRVVYGIENKEGVLTALFPFSEREKTLSQSVSRVRDEYKEISFGREILKQAFRVALAIIIVLSVLFALWAAFIFSRRLTQPVRDLVEGTLAVASGDLEKKLPVSNRDDFSLLARSFNTMTKRLSNVQEEREQARKQLQQEHDYLDVVLEHLSSGVVTLDENRVIRRVNSSASRILNEPMQEQVGQGFETVCEQSVALKPFLQALQPWLQHPDQDWLSEIDLSADGRRKVLMCRGASLPENNMQQQGYVLVFEDVSDVVQAEHDAAWGEVARRLAHEIKNPLTPIQLSAERLSRKLGKVLDEDSTIFLNRMTGTIIQQVDTLKEMVNAFSDYARAPALAMRSVDLNRIITEVAALYQSNEQQVRLELALDDTLQMMQIDPHRIRQLLVNLIKNALEAIGADNESGQHGQGKLVIRTEVEQSDPARCTSGVPNVMLSLQDNGSGIPEDMLPQLFEPYVTNKRKGTGLGLAIVKKIVEEHGGSLSAGNLEPKGAMISITLPMVTRSANAGSNLSNYSKER